MSGFKLIPDWRLAWRFLSVQAAMLLALLSGIQAEVLPLVAPLFPDSKWPIVSGGLALLVVLLRLLAQDGLATARAELELDALEATTDRLPLDQPMPAPPAKGQMLPAGRFEQWLGAVVLLLIVLAVCGLAAFTWFVWGVR